MNCPRDPQISHEHPSAIQQYVRRLDIPVHECRCVRMRESLKHCAGDTNYFTECLLTFALQSLLKGFTSDKRHHVIRDIIDLTGI